MISRHFSPPRLRVLAGAPRPVSLRTWAQRFWDPEELFGLKATLLLLVTLLGAWVGA